MPTLLFVCTANRFRSPLAAAYAARQVRDAGLPADWQAASAGTWTPAGLPAHAKALEAAARLGLDLSAHRTREVDAALLAAASLVVVMEPGHKEALEAEFPACRGRVALLGELAGWPDPVIPDPAQANFTDSDAIARAIAACLDQALPAIRQRVEKPSPPLLI